MGWRKEEFGPNTKLLLVSFSDPADLRAYAQHRELPYEVLHDENQSVYKTYGLEKGSISDLWGFKAMRRYLKIIARDGMAEVRKPVDDWQQLGGDFVIAADGTLAYGHWSGGPGDRPSVEDLIEAVALAAPAAPPPPRPEDRRSGDAPNPNPPHVSGEWTPPPLPKRIR